MFASSAYIVLVLLGIFIHFVKCENVTRTCEPLPNIYQIAEFYLNVIGLIERAPRIDEYANFFDESLRAEMQRVFARIRGFAHDETQANQWEEETRRFLRAFTLRTIAAQGGAHLDAYFAQQRANSRDPETLLEQSIRQVNEQIVGILDCDFAPPNITDEILFYELIYLSRLRITTVNINNAPYFQLRLTTPVAQRFIDENQPGTSSSASSSHPRPYMPLENYLEDCEPLLNIYNYLDFSRFIYDLSDIFRKPLHEHVHDDVLNYAREHIRSFLSPKILPSAGEEILCWSFFEILARFLSADYVRLSCHPIYVRSAENDVRVRQIMEQLERARATQMESLTDVRNFFINNLRHIDLIGQTERFIAFLEQSGVVVRYLKHKPYILISFSHSRNQTNC